MRQELDHFLKLFAQSGVKVVFSGHEHNFQSSEASAETGGIRWVVTGAGGQLRDRNVAGRLGAARIEAWAPAHHFLLVELDERALRITPIGIGRRRVEMITASGGRITRLPEVRLSNSGR